MNRMGMIAQAVAMIVTTLIGAVYLVCAVIPGEQVSLGEAVGAAAFIALGHSLLPYHSHQ